jgi:hypothetical protein
LLILLFKNVLKISNFEKSAKTSKKLKKPYKNSKKKLQKFFCLGAFTREGKIACFMLNFLNLKSFPSYLFFVVASSLSILCTGIGKGQEIFQRPYQRPHLNFIEIL